MSSYWNTRTKFVMDNRRSSSPESTIKTTKIYVGGLVEDVGNDRLQDVFSKFGKIRKVWVARNPHSKGYAFVDFFEHRHAKSAVKAMNGSVRFKSKLRVQLSNNELSSSSVYAKKERYTPLSNNNGRFRDLGYDRAIVKSSANKLNTPALETLIHLEKLARLRLEQEILKTIEPDQIHTIGKFSDNDGQSNSIRDLIVESIGCSKSLHGDNVDMDQDTDLFHSRNTHSQHSLPFSPLPGSYSQKASYNQRAYSPRASYYQRAFSQRASYSHRTQHGSYDNFRKQHDIMFNTNDRKQLHGNNFRPYKARMENQSFVRNSEDWLDGPNEDLKPDSYVKQPMVCTSDDSHGLKRHNDWYGQKFYGFGFLPDGTDNTQGNNIRPEHTFATPPASNLQLGRSGNNLTIPPPTNINLSRTVNTFNYPSPTNIQLYRIENTYNHSSPTHGQLRFENTSDT